MYESTVLYWMGNFQVLNYCKGSFAMLFFYVHDVDNVRLLYSVYNENFVLKRRIFRVIESIFKNALSRMGIFHTPKTEG